MDTEKKRKMKKVILGAVLILAVIGIVCYFVFRKKQ